MGSGNQGNTNSSSGTNSNTNTNTQNPQNQGQVGQNGANGQPVGGSYGSGGKNIAYIMMLKEAMAGPPGRGQAAGDEQVDGSIDGTYSDPGGGGGGGGGGAC